MTFLHLWREAVRDLSAGESLLLAAYVVRGVTWREWFVLFYAATHVALGATLVRAWRRR